MSLRGTQTAQTVRLRCVKRVTSFINMKVNIYTFYKTKSLFDCLFVWGWIDSETVGCSGSKLVSSESVRSGGCSRLCFIEIRSVVRVWEGKTGFFSSLFPLEQNWLSSACARPFAEAVDRAVIALIKERETCWVSYVEKEEECYKHGWGI